jgi:hypothetical protein
LRICSNNDWDPVREIVVGTATGAGVRTLDVSTMSFAYADQRPEDVRRAIGAFPQWLIDEANEDLEGLVAAIRAFGATVHRPVVADPAVEFGTPDWRTAGWYSWSPRDLLLPLRNLMIEAPSPTRARYFETRAYEHVMLDAIRDGVEWIAAPKPALRDDLFTFDDLSQPTLRDLEPAFDAPNVVRLGRDLLYQVSNTGNRMGLRWLRNVLEPRGYRLHAAEHLYSFAHFDSTILPLRPGLVLLNGTRVTPANCPRIFAKWDKIYFTDIVRATPDARVTLPPAASDYIALNVLSLDASTVCVEERQLPLMHALEAHGITCVPLRMRHARTLSGGFHCVTLDLVRDGGLEDYC